MIAVAYNAKFNVKNSYTLFFRTFNHFLIKVIIFAK